MADSALNMKIADSSGITRNVRQPSTGRVHIPLLIIVVLLLAFGLTIVWSATRAGDQYEFSHQFVGVAAGLVAGFVLWRIDYRVFSQLVIPLLIVVVVLLLLPHVPGIGVTVNNAASWIKVGMQFQPSEPCKIATILLMAAAVSRYQGYIESLGDYIKMLLLMAVPVACLATQPDLGTGTVYIAICIVILFVGGVDRKWLLLTIGAGVALIGIALIVDPILDRIVGHDVFIYDYQLNRLLSFANADLDPDGSGYNVQQAKVAIGSGGFLGKGIGDATQSALGFLPEAPTDFIFCVLSEELGFVGALILLSLYGLLFFFTFKIAAASSDLYGTLIAMGVAGMWFYQILENIGMTCGLLPCTGIPLPFMSYGSSSMIANLMAVGLLLNVWSHRSITVASQMKE